VTRRQVHLAFAGVLAVMFLAGLDGTIVATALPSIAADLSGFDHMSWIVTAYLLGATVTIPIYGKLSDLYGRRRLLAIAVVVFLIGSALCGIAQSMGELIAFRALQGLGAGGLIPLAIAIIGDLFAARERGRYQGFTGAVFASTAILGPLAGGVITDHVSWRWIFYVNLPFGALALALVLATMHLPVERRKRRIDYLGVATLTTATISALLVVVWGGTELPWSSPAIVGLACAAAAAAAAFVLVERRAAEPLVPLRLFRNAIFTVVMVASAIMGAAMFIVIVYVPVVVQQVLGTSATSSGAILIPFMLSSICASVVTGQITMRTGRYKIFPISGSILVALGFFLLSRLGEASSGRDVIVALVVAGVGTGQIFQTYTIAVQNAVDPRELGTATAASQFFRSVGQTLGVAAFGVVLTHRLTSELAERLGPGESVAARRLLEPRAPNLAPDTLEHARGALAAAIDAGFLYCLPLLALAIVCALLLKERPLGTVAPHAARREDDLAAASAD
jgi:EmrB/QacA subfamily drug resistance transporter